MENNISAAGRVQYFIKAWRRQNTATLVATAVDSFHERIELNILDLEAVFALRLAEGAVTITTDEAGQCVAVTRQDADGKILKTLWEAPVKKIERTVPEEGTEWRHSKGGIYTVILVTSEPDGEKADKFPRSVVYRAEDGRTWTRTLESWYKSFKPL